MLFLFAAIRGIGNWFREWILRYLDGAFFLVFIVEFHAKVACTKEILIMFDYLEISYYFRFYFSLDTVFFRDWNVSLLLR